MYFCYFIIISFLEKVVALHLNKTDFPSPKDAMCQVQLKLAQWYVLEKILDSLNLSMIFFTVSLLSSFGKGPSFE